MRKIYALIAVLTVACVVAVNRYADSAGHPAPRPVSRDKDFEKLENSIIIHGISNDAGESHGERDDDEGRIIVDDDFLSHESRVEQASPHSPFQKEFSVIRRKDPRWHLTRYMIKNGDNLWSIAKRFRTDHTLIIKANSITDPDMLGRGKSILVPNRSGVSYKIRKNDTLTAIARKFSVDAESVRSHNGIGVRIAAGNTLFIPDARPPKKTERKERAKNAASSVARGEERESSRAFLWPLSGRITSSFGRRISPITGQKSFHTGMDIGCHMDTPVKASAGGKVIFSGWKDVFGNMIIIKHDRGFITVYAHNKSNTVREDDEVKAGDIIAHSGMTGSVTGPHLHFEIRKHLTPLNPRRFLR